MTNGSAPQQIKGQCYLKGQMPFEPPDIKSQSCLKCQIALLPQVEGQYNLTVQITLQPPGAFHLNFWKFGWYPNCSQFWNLERLNCLKNDRLKAGRLLVGRFESLKDGTPTYNHTQVTFQISKFCNMFKLAKVQVFDLPNYSNFQSVHFQTSNVWKFNLSRFQALFNFLTIRGPRPAHGARNTATEPLSVIPPS